MNGGFHEDVVATNVIVMNVLDVAVVVLQPQCCLFRAFGKLRR